MSYVYFIQAGTDGPVKIGVTSNIMKRMDALQVGHHEQLILLGSVAGGYEVEKHWHTRWSAHHIRGEWFKPDDALLYCIFESTLGKPHLRKKWGEPFGPFRNWRCELCPPEQHAYGGTCRDIGKPKDAATLQIEAVEARQARMYRRRARREKAAA